MTVHRVEITLSDETWERLEAARGHEPRASFVKRALESALEGPARAGESPPVTRPEKDPAAAVSRPASSRASDDVEAHKAVHRDFARAAESENIAESVGVRPASAFVKRNVKPIPKRPS